MIKTTSDKSNPSANLVALDPIAIARKFTSSASARGGCCLELNGGLAWLLQQLGYASVRLVPCFVAAGRERGHASSSKPKFRTVTSHFIVLVNDEYLVDVGLGEPPLQPLHYNAKMINQPQVTPEGMTSRIVLDPKGAWTDGQGRVRTCVLLEWLVPDEHKSNNDSSSLSSSWQPRLQWDVADAPLQDTKSDNPPPSPPTVYTLESFRHVIPLLAHPKSTWSRKLVVCRLTHTHKITLAGQALKITSPRFGKDAKVTVTSLETEEAVRRALRTHFGIVLFDDEQLDWTASRHAQNTQLWHHL